MSRATETQLDDLHGLVAESYIAQIQSYKDKGEPIPVSLLEKAAKFLKDNGIDAPLKSGSPLDRLKDTLPRFDDEVGGFVASSRHN